MNTAPLTAEADLGEVEALAAKAATGDMDAFGALYARYIDSTYRWVYVRVKDEALARDVTADIWMKILRSISTYTPRGKGFVGFLFTVARTVLCDEYRTKSRRPETPTSDMLALDHSSTDISPEEHAERSETARLLAEGIRQLTAQQAECVTLRFFNGMTIAETAAVMGTTEGAVKQYQLRGLRALKRILPEHMRSLGAAVSVSTVAKVVTAQRVAVTTVTTTMSPRGGEHVLEAESL